MDIYQSHNTPRKRVQITFAKKGRTKQSFKDDCDINKIIARHTRTGQIGHLNKNNPGYGYATSQDFSEAMRTITDAQNGFNDLSEEIQNRFNNDPGALLDFAQNPDNQAEGEQLGLWPKTPTTGPKEPETPPEKPPEDKKTDTESKKD